MLPSGEHVAVMHKALGSIFSTTANSSTRSHSTTFWLFPPRPPYPILTALERRAQTPQVHQLNPQVVHTIAKKRHQLSQKSELKVTLSTVDQGTPLWTPAFSPRVGFETVQ